MINHTEDRTTLHHTDENGNAPVNLAAGNGHRRCVDLLMTEGANMRQRWPEGGGGEGVVFCRSFASNTVIQLIIIIFIIIIIISVCVCASP